MANADSARDCGHSDDQRRVVASYVRARATHQDLVVYVARRVYVFFEHRAHDVNVIVMTCHHLFQCVYPLEFRVDRQPSRAEPPTCPCSRADCMLSVSSCTGTILPAQRASD